MTTSFTPVTDDSSLDQEIREYNDEPAAFGNTTTIALITSVALQDTPTFVIQPQSYSISDPTTLLVYGNGNTLSGDLQLGPGSNLTLENLVIDPDLATTGGVTTGAGAAVPVLTNVTLVAHTAADLTQDLAIFNANTAGVADSVTISLASDIAVGALQVQNRGNLTVAYNGYTLSGAGAADLVGANVIHTGQVLTIDTAADLTNAITQFNLLGAGTQLVLQLGTNIVAATLPAVTGHGQLILNDGSFAVSGAGATALQVPQVVTNTPNSVFNTQDLIAAIQRFDSAPSGSDQTIVVQSDITLTADLPLIDGHGTLTIIGNGHTLSGGDVHRGLFVYAGTTDVNNLTIADAVAHGGAGGSGYAGGGGGAGLGGGLFVAAGAGAVLTGVTFENDAAIGGAGGTVDVYNTGGGGGGGLGGDGGSASLSITNAGGGGGGIGLPYTATGAGATNLTAFQFPGMGGDAYDAAGAGSGGGQVENVVNEYFFALYKSYTTQQVIAPSPGGSSGGGGGAGASQEAGGGGGGIGGGAASDFNNGATVYYDHTAALEAGIALFTVLAGPIPGLNVLSSAFQLALGVAQTAQGQLSGLDAFATLFDDTVSLGLAVFGSSTALAGGAEAVAGYQSLGEEAAQVAEVGAVSDLAAPEESIAQVADDPLGFDSEESALLDHNLPASDENDPAAVQQFDAADNQGSALEQLQQANMSEAENSASAQEASDAEGGPGKQTFRTVYNQIASHVSDAIDSAKWEIDEAVDEVKSAVGKIKSSSIYQNTIGALGRNYSSLSYVQKLIVVQGSKSVLQVVIAGASGTNPLTALRDKALSGSIGDIITAVTNDGTVVNGAPAQPTSGGTGGYGGGGGGGGGVGGQGGFGGGGGGGGIVTNGTSYQGGNGGFGGGGGGGGLGAEGGTGNSLDHPSSAFSGFGGGNGTDGVVKNKAGNAEEIPSEGGGGLGAGGAIFVQDGGNVTLGGGDSFIGNSVTGGAAYNPGFAFGDNVFLQGNQTLYLAPAAGQTTQVGDIADENGSQPGYTTDAAGLDITGEGTVDLTGTNTYTGLTTVGDASGAQAFDSGKATANGVLVVAADAVLSAQTIVVYDGATLDFEAGSFFSGIIDETNVTVPSSVTINIDPDAIFEGGITAPGTSTVSPVSYVSTSSQQAASASSSTFFSAIPWTHDYTYLPNGNELFQLTPVSGGTDSQQIGVASLSSLQVRNGADISALLDAIAQSNVYILSPTLLLNSGTLDDSLIGGNPIVIPNGIGAVTLAASGTSAVLGRLDLVLSYQQPLVLSAAPGQTLTIGANIFDPLAFDLSGDLDPNAAIVTGMTPVQNNVASLYTLLLPQVQVTDDTGEIQSLDIYLTKTGTYTWELTVFDAQQRVNGGTLPYSGPPLATETLTFFKGQPQNSGPLQVALPDGRDVLLQTTGLIQADAVVSGNLSSLALPDAGALPNQNVAGAAYGTELTVTAQNAIGAQESVDLYFTNIGTDTWQVAAFTASASHAPGTFPYASGAFLASETLTFSLGAVTDGGVFFVPGSAGANLILDLSQVTESSSPTSLLASTDVNDPSLSQVPLQAAPSAPSAIDVNGGGLVRLSGINTFTGGIQIDNGTLELGSSAQAYGGTGPSFYQLKTTDGFGNPITLDLYLTKIGTTPTPTYEVTAYNAADEALGEGFPYANGPLGVASFTLDSTGAIEGQPVLSIIPPSGGVFALSIGIGAALANQGTDVSQAPTIALAGTLSSAATIAAGSLPSSNLTGASYTASTVVTFNGDSPQPVYLAVYFTETAADTWQVDVFDASTAATSGAFPYRSGDLASETVTFDAAGSIAANPLPVIVNGQTLTLSLTGIQQSSGSVSQVSPVEAVADFTPIAGAADFGALPSQDISPAADAGNGAITFGNTGSTEVLQIDGGILLNPIDGFRAGDAIDLAGVTLAAQQLTTDTAGLLITQYGSGSVILQFGTDLPAGSLFQLTPYAGGTSVTLLPTSFVASTQADFAADLAAIEAGGADAAADTSYQIIANFDTLAGGTIALDSGSTLEVGGFWRELANAWTLQSGVLDLSGDNFFGAAGGKMLEVASGATAVLSGVVFDAPALIAVDAGGSLDLSAGTMSATTTITVAGQGLTAEPPSGGSVLLDGTIAGTLHVGTDAGLGGTVALGGMINQGSVELDGPGTLDILAGASLGGPIVLDDPGNGVLRLEVGAQPSAIDWVTGAGEIDLVTTGTHTASVTPLTAAANGQLAIPGYGTLSFTGPGADNAAYTLVADGSGTLRLLAPLQAVSIADGNQFHAFAAGLGSEPQGVSIVADVTLTGTSIVTDASSGDAGLLGLPSGVQLAIQGTAGFDVASGDVLALAGNNSFTGGITIEAGATVDLETGSSAGTGTIQFAGTDAVLSLAAPVANIIADMAPSDAIDLTSVAPAGGVSAIYHETAAGVVAIGGVDLTFASLGPETAFLGTSDGKGGTLLSPIDDQVTFTVSTQADLTYALQQVDASTAVGATYTIDLAPGLGTLTLTGDLPAINLAPGVGLFINGNGGTLNAGGTTRGLLAYAGSVLIENLTIDAGVARGGNGGSGGLGGGGGGAGLGGDLMVGPSADVEINNVLLLNGGAIGGNGGGVPSGDYYTLLESSGAGGGGGLGGAGGNGVTSASTVYANDLPGLVDGSGNQYGLRNAGISGGGGGVGSLANGGQDVPGTGGTGIVAAAADAGATAFVGVAYGYASEPYASGGGSFTEQVEQYFSVIAAAGLFAGGGASGVMGGGGGLGARSGWTEQDASDDVIQGAAGSGGWGGGGGGGGGDIPFWYDVALNSGGSGGFGGGGGGGDEGEGGNGGFGGGGGGAIRAYNSMFDVVGGSGGFGAGSGGSSTFGSGDITGGGGGLGAGGGAFVEQGGTLLIDGGVSESGGSVTAGLGADGGGNGSALGAGLFLMGTITLAPAAGTKDVISDAIADQGNGSGGIVVDGPGTVELDGDDTYTGATTVIQGTLVLGASATLRGPVDIGPQGTLVMALAAFDPLNPDARGAISDQGALILGAGASSGNTVIRSSAISAVPGSTFTFNIFSGSANADPDAVLAAGLAQEATRGDTSGSVVTYTSGYSLYDLAQNLVTSLGSPTNPDFGVDYFPPGAAGIGVVPDEIIYSITTNGLAFDTPDYNLGWTVTPGTSDGATTEVIRPATVLNPADGLIINGVTVTNGGYEIVDLVQSIDNAGIPGVTASIDNTSGQLVLISTGSLQVSDPAGDPTLAQLGFSAPEHILPVTEGLAAATATIDSGLTLLASSVATFGTLTGGGTLVVAQGGDVSVGQFDDFTGPVEVDGGTLTALGTLAVAVTIAAGDVQATATSGGGGISFTDDSTGTLSLAGSPNEVFANPVGGTTAQMRIDLTGIGTPLSPYVFANSAGQLVVQGLDGSATIQLAGSAASYGGTRFATQNDSNGGILITPQPTSYYIVATTQDQLASDLLAISNGGTLAGAGADDDSIDVNTEYAQPYAGEIFAPTVDIDSSTLLLTGLLQNYGTNAIAVQTGSVTVSQFVYDAVDPYQPAFAIGSLASLGIGSGVTIVGAIALDGNQTLVATPMAGMGSDLLIGQIADDTASNTGTGAAQLVMDGTGTLTLGDPNWPMPGIAHFTGGVVLDSGELDIAVSGVVGSGNLLIQGGLAVIEPDAASVGSGRIVFAREGQTLDIGSRQTTDKTTGTITGFTFAVANVIAGFDASDTIDILVPGSAVPPTGILLAAGNQLSVSTAQSTTGTIDLDPSRSYADDVFIAQSGTVAGQAVIGIGETSIPGLSSIHPSGPAALDVALAHGESQAIAAGLSGAFANIAMSGGTLDLAGSNTFTAGGGLTVSEPGLLTLSGSDDFAAGAGITIDSAGLELASATALNGAPVSFGNAGGTLRIDQAMNGQTIAINNFTTADTILLADYGLPSGLMLNAGTLTVSGGEWVGTGATGAVSFVLGGGSDTSDVFALTPQAGPGGQIEQALQIMPVAGMVLDGPALARDIASISGAALVATASPIDLTFIDYGVQSGTTYVDPGGTIALGSGNAISLPDLDLATNETATIAGEVLDGGGTEHGFIVQSGDVTLEVRDLTNLVAPAGIGGAVQVGTAAAVTLYGTVSGGSGSSGQAGAGIGIEAGGSLTLGAGAIDDVIAGAGGVLVDALPVGPPQYAGQNLIYGGAEETLAAANSFTGGLTLTSGSLLLSAAGAAGSGPVTVDGGVLYVMAAGALGSDPVTVNGGTVVVSSSVYNDTLPVATDTGTGPLTVAGGAVIVTGSNDLTSSGVTIVSGLLQLGGPGPMTAAPTITMQGGGTLQIATGPSYRYSALTVAGLASGGSLDLDFDYWENLGPAAVGNGTVDLNGMILLGVAGIVARQEGSYAALLNATGGAEDFHAVQPSLSATTLAGLDQAIAGASEYGGNDAAYTTYTLAVAGPALVGSAETIGAWASTIDLDTGDFVNFGFAVAGQDRASALLIDSASGAFAEAFDVAQGTVTFGSVDLDDMTAGSATGGVFLQVGSFQASADIQSLNSDFGSASGGNAGIAVASGGTLTVNSGWLTAQTPIDLASGGTLVLDPASGSGVAVQAGGIAGGGSVLIDGAGTVTMDALGPDFTGTLIVTGTVEAAGAASRSLTLAGDGRLVVPYGEAFGTVSGLSASAMIDFLNVAPSALTYSHIGGNLAVDGVELSGAGAVQAESDGSGGSLVYLGSGTSNAVAASITVATADALNAALTAISTGSLAATDTDYTVILAPPSGGTIALDSNIASIDLAAGSELTVLGNGTTLDGQGRYAGFVALGGAVTLDDLTIANAAVVGGAGGDAPPPDAAGGGGAGLGGGLFVAGPNAGIGSGATVTLEDVSFAGDSATGGNGGSVYPSGFPDQGGGGQLDGIGAAVNGLGGGLGANGVNGGFGGGGGPGGSGGFGGGGGGGAAGGYGAGAGTDQSGTNLPGGGGLGAGGDIFVQQGGSLIVGAGVLGMGSVHGGAGGNDDANHVADPGGQAGQGLGGAAFLQNTSDITLAPGAWQTTTIDGPIATQGSPGTLVDAGAGTVLFASQGMFAGNIVIESGATLAIDTNQTNVPGAISDAGLLALQQVPGVIVDEQTPGGAVYDDNASPFGNAIAGSGGVSIGAGGVWLTGTLGWTGGTSIGAGNTLILGSDLSGLTGAINDQGALIYAGAGSTTLGATISGNGALIIEGNGFTNSNVTLTATNSFSGGVQVASGEALALEAPGAAGSGIISLQTLSATGPSGTEYYGASGLLIGGGDAPANTIAGFLPGDVIDLAGFANTVNTTVSLTATDVLVVSDGTHTVGLQLSQSASGEGFYTGPASDGLDVYAALFPASVPGQVISAAPNAQVVTTSANGLLAAANNPAHESLAVVPESLTGTYGSIQIASDGSYTYTAGATLQQQAALAALVGSQAADNFSYTYTDPSTGAMKTAQLTARMDRPAVVSGVVAQQTGDDQNVTIPFGHTSVSDPDSPSQVLIVSLTLNETEEPSGGGGATAVSALLGGSLTEASLAASGFAANASNPGEFDFSGSAAQVTSALQALVFQPAPHFLDPGAALLTSFDLGIVSNGASATAATTLMTEGLGGQLAVMPITASVTQRSARSGNLLSSVTYPAADTNLLVSSVATGDSVAQPVTGGVATVVGRYGTLTVAPDGSYTYDATHDALTAGETYTDAFIFTVADPVSFPNQPATTTLTLDVTGSPDADPVLPSVVIGGTGYATLIAGNGLDTLIGGPAGDAIIAGGGGDTLVAGAGADDFVLPATTNSTSSDPEQIQGFRSGVDTIDLTGLPYSAYQITVNAGTTELSAYGQPSLFQLDVQGVVGPADIKAGAAPVYVGDTGVDFISDLGALLAGAGQGPIVVTDNSPVDVTLAQFEAYPNLRSLLVNGNDSPVQIDIVDSAADLSGPALDTLENYAQINEAGYAYSKIIVAANGPADGGYIATSASQLNNDYLIAGNGGGTAEIAYAGGGTRVLNVVDTAANIAANFFEIANDAANETSYSVPSIGAITVSDNAPVYLSGFSTFDLPAIEALRNANGMPADVIIDPYGYLTNSIGLQSQIANVPTIAGSALPLGTVTFAVDGTPLPTTATADSSGNWTIAFSSLSAGPHVITSIEANSFGNAGTSSTTVTVDPTAPSLAIAGSPYSFLTVDRPDVTLTGTIDPADAGDTISILSFRSSPVAAVRPNPSGAWAVTVPVSGYDDLVASVTDANGNQIASPTEVSVGYSATAVVPVITGTASGQAILATRTIAPFANVAITDQNVGQTETVTVIVSDPANGTLTDPNQPTDGGAVVDGFYTLTGSAAAVSADLDNLLFKPAPHEVAPGQTVATAFTISVVDSVGAAAADAGTSVIATAPVDTFNWTGAAGTDFSNPANWDDATYGLDPATSAPTAMTDASFSNSGGTITGTGTVSAATFGGDGIWNLTEGAMLTVQGSLTIGGDSLGDLLIDQGSSLISEGPVTLAAQSAAGGSSASLNNATWTVANGLTVGAAATANLSLSGASTLTATTLDAGLTTGSAGIISLSGTSTSLGITGTAGIGDAGQGELSVLDGATVTVGGDLDIGNAAGGSGNVDIENATLAVSGALNLGDGGPGVLTVGAGARVSLAGGLIGGPDAALVQFAPIDPPVLDGGTDTINFSGEQDFSAYIDGGANIDIDQGYSLSLDTPLIDGGVQFAIGQSSADTQATTLVLNAGSVSSDSGVTFKSLHGTLVIGTDALGTIDTQASDSAGVTLVANPSLGVPLIGGFGASIYGFKAGDHVIVDTTQAATFTQSDNVVSVNANGVTLGSLTFATTAMAHLAATTAGALVDQVVQCFAAGTRIRTDRGEAAVEDLRAGDRVWSVLGRCHAPVVWIGHRAVDCARHKQPRAVWPVRVAAGAFGPGMPVRDVWLSPDHAVYVDGVLVPVRHLVNGTTIAQVPRDSVTYYHVELDRHDVLLADGLPAESYLDTGERANFANGGGVITLHPDFGRAADVWEMAGCAPLVVTGAALQRARAFVSAVAEAAA